MNERLQKESAEYWHDDREIGRAQLWGETYTLFLRTHATTRAYLPDVERELVPLWYPGLYTFMAGQLYVLEPRLSPLDHWRRLTKQPLPARQRELETVRVGDVQAAVYDRDTTLVLWQCGLLPQYLDAEPALDAKLRAAWRGTEAALEQTFPGVQRIVTPSWQPAYAVQEYREFLWDLGYERLSRFAFVKPLVATGKPSGSSS